MEIDKTLEEYDGLFGKKSLDEIDRYLSEKVEQAYEEKDYFSAVTLLNEQMGFCRDTDRKEKGLECCVKVVELLGRLGMEGSEQYATTLLNVANAFRAFGYQNESLKIYQKVRDLYHERLPEDSLSYASLYNNWGLLYQEMNEFENAEEMFKKALSIIDRYPQERIKQATTRTNLAVSLLHVKGSQKEKAADEAKTFLLQALDIYETAGGDFHYSAALSAMGDFWYRDKEYPEAVFYYKKAMDELENYVGKTENYDRVKENYEEALRLCSPGKNLMLCRKFYEKYGQPMIHEKFPAYEKRIAAGLIGEGSDCFFFDDEISKDHDYGIGFCLWLTDEDYRKIGSELNEEYEKLVLTYTEQFLKEEGVPKWDSVNKFINDRRGVMTIEGFYERILGISVKIDSLQNKNFPSEKQWFDISEDKFATAVNGMLFQDDLGIFMKIRRRLISYYPEKIRRLKLACHLHDFSQYAQSNYGRMMARKDELTAQICKAEGIKSAMQIVYLLNRKYAPYYKWMRKGTENLSVLREVMPILERIVKTENQSDVWKEEAYDPYRVHTEDQIIALFEEAAGMILDEMNRQNLVKGKERFLEIYCRELTNVTTKEPCLKSEMERDSLVECIVKAEWRQFDKVKNEGGRADCQDDWNTFSVMRKSQYLTWPAELLKSYYSDLEAAEKKGWNLVMEKYARMMESTEPEKYEGIKKDLPERNEQRIAIQEEIIRIQVEWMEEFAEKYPKMAENARSIHSAEDSPYNTSYETYLRGEIGTYSDATLMLYGRFIVELKKAGENLACKIMDNTAKLYGYESAQDAENKL